MKKVFINIDSFLVNSDQNKNLDKTFQFLDYLSVREDKVSNIP